MICSIIGTLELEDINLNQLDELPSTFEEVQLTEEEEKYFDRNDINLKLDYSNFENHIHFGSAVSKLDNFVTKMKNIEVSLKKCKNFFNSFVCF